MGLKEKIKSNPKLEKLAHWMLSPKNQARPRKWIILFVNPFFHKKGKGSIHFLQGRLARFAVISERIILATEIHHNY